ncbi:GvpL/GvpF family gas vesicle protein [Kitasatospora sp. NBC_00240]|uniref:GvpL/GvpF family gas vesicle protein n=1 Tax=Kitasatospora sp. NBC_00240 TaxID=2903567 RepID=UPI00225BFF64|nr:GvpL/GvpF family gas vesicle protein [Kitasatospora sp. NBC_00240]MCX5215255.1 GvpL/GvpF family gas vesicle protein [Kitasatospora sp. NBC_00240]
MAVYVYSVVDAAHPLRLEDLRGVGESPGELRTVTAGPLCAVVSDAPPDLRPKRRDLAAHQAVQERLMSDGTVLPLRFGLTAESDDLVRKALEGRTEEYTARLEALEGCAEYHLKAAEDQETLLRRILEESEEARTLNDEIRGGGGGPDLPLALGEIVAEEVRVRQEALAAGVVQALRPFARDERSSQPVGDDFLNISFLVARADEKEFREAEQGIAERLGESVDFRLRGPLPAYSFV